MKANAYTFVVMTIVIALAAGCSTDQPSSGSTPAETEGSPNSQQLVFTAIGDYIVPGTAHLARLKGFTECKDTYYTLTCQHTKPPSFFGAMVVSAQIDLTRGNHAGTESDAISAESKDIKGATLDELSYDSISLTFKPTEFDEACLKRSTKESWERPNECAKANTIGAALHAMKNEGWILVSERKGNRTWMHPGTAATISSSNFGPDNMLRLSKADLEEVQSTLADHAARELETAKQKAASQSLVDQMKTN